MPSHNEALLPIALAAVHPLAMRRSAYRGRVEEEPPPKASLERRRSVRLEAPPQELLALLASKQQKSALGEFVIHILVPLIT